MEKFHKYCLSVLLVIICSNISAQISSGNLRSEDCKQLYEIYNQFLNSKDSNALEKIFLNEKSRRKLRISDKKNAVDLLGSIFSHKNQNYSYHKIDTSFFEKEKHCQILINFLKESKENVFAEDLYFKSKVSKIRNKDYLDVVV
ncbi:hypothetical protein NAL32_15360 [Chryseobacterium sp. Ch-15]|uniref:Uncharacterized protein n=1 Tax=Chryseobacterium muglaense TaxID=2893752 RepID=A0A9Q3YS78_9FLAO|nr:hypothetical protein [Chryseobacterium muglaense]MBD3905963.1 hypothetical protein [Chryseobacterium muglaense]MCC9035048.1 hypothetical protein [Chryseobacterium muglaense]MCM2555761.1 hypothetical protein [Chryseobacterium muglaense]